MLRMRSSRLTVAVLLAAVVILVVGGAAIASNMGFKLNKGYSLPVTGCANCGRNWTSLPFNSPYVNVAGLCSQLGLTSTGGVRATGTFLNENTGAFATFTCGTAAAGSASATLITGKGIDIRQPNVAGRPASFIIVGSHNPAASQTIPDAGTGQIGNLWWSVPYHTTAVTFADVCNQIGMTSTGGLRGSLSRLRADTGSFATASCGTAAAGSNTLVLGEHIQLREPNGPKTFTGQHF